MSDLYDEGYVKSHNVLAMCQGLTKRQLDYWARAGYVASFEETPGRGNPRMFHKREVPLIKYMNILVNQLGMGPDKAVKIAQTAIECVVVSRGYTWVDFNGIHFGLPLLPELQ